MWGRVFYNLGDGFTIMRFGFGGNIAGNNFARESVPEKDFFAIVASAESLTARNEFCYLYHTLYYSKNML